MKRTVEIDVGNLNIVEALVTSINLGETEMDDIYGLNNVMDEIAKDKQSKEATDKVFSIHLLSNLQKDIL